MAIYVKKYKFEEKGKELDVIVQELNIEKEDVKDKYDLKKIDQFTKENDADSYCKGYIALYSEICERIGNENKLSEQKQKIIERINAVENEMNEIIHESANLTEEKDTEKLITELNKLVKEREDKCDLKKKQVIRNESKSTPLTESQIKSPSAASLTKQSATPLTVSQIKSPSTKQSTASPTATPTTQPTEPSTKILATSLNTLSATPLIQISNDREMQQIEESTIDLKNYLNKMSTTKFQKARKWMTPLEINAMVGEMNSKLDGMNVNTVYDINRRLYVIKLSKTDKKEFIVIESGCRVHLTEYNREKSDTPNNFTSRLRKYLNKKKFVGIKQVGNDRVVELTFGSATEIYHLLVDLYSLGNICLTDSDYNIILALRQFTFDKTGDKVAPKEKYPLHLLVEKMGHELIQELLKEYTSLRTSEAVKDYTFKKFLSNTTDFGQQLIEHCFRRMGKDFDNRKKIEDFTDEELELMKNVITEGIGIFNCIGEGKGKGYIVYEGNEEKMHYQEVTCYLFEQMKNKKVKEFVNYCDAMDNYHSLIEKQEYDLEVEKKELLMKKKIQVVVNGHQKRYQGLLTKADDLQRKAQTIEANVTIVDQIINEINVFLKQKMAWAQIEQMIVSAKEKSPESIAQYIEKFEFVHDIVVVKLPFENTSVLVELFLTMNAFENVRSLYDTRKMTLIKAQKTLESKDVALEQASQKQRRIYEKKTDIYVHADAHGAASCLIKGIPGKTIGAATLEQAGRIAVCRSSAWSNKIVTSAYWVYTDQVSKTAPSGEYLSTGSFMIRGKKNYLPPSPLIFGIGIMFAVEKDDSIQPTSSPLQDSQTSADDQIQDQQNSNETPLVDVGEQSKTFEVETDIHLDEKHGIEYERVEFVTKKQEEIRRQEQQKAEKVKKERKKQQTEDALEQKKGKPKAVRKQHLKKKNLKKYADQDEDDRKRMEQRVGHVFKEEVKTDAELDSKPSAKLVCYVCGSEGHISRDCPVKRKQNELKNEQMLVDKVKELDDEDDEDTFVDDTLFVGNLLPSMNVKYAVPVCGPYECISKYKYHLKLTPGTAKSGKAIKNIINIFSNVKDATELEKALLSGITTDEYVNVMMSDVQVHSSYGKIKQKPKKKPNNNN
ncbi:Ribosome quality control complex subunit 2 [Entamoeba marina]